MVRVIANMPLGSELLRRIVDKLGWRFAQYVVVDGEFATAPFLHTVDDLGLKVIARLKLNLPELLHAAEARFGHRRPSRIFKNGSDRIEIWDADDFDPWDALDWKTVRVIRYRQHRPDGTIIEAYWLTNFSAIRRFRKLVPNGQGAVGSRKPGFQRRKESLRFRTYHPS